MWTSFFGGYEMNLTLSFQRRSDNQFGRVSKCFQNQKSMFGLWKNVGVNSLLFILVSSLGS